MRNRLTLAAILVACAFPAAAQVHRSEEHAFTVTTVARGLDHPWSVAFLPDGRLLITEREGRLRIVKDGKLDPQPVTGLPPVAPHGQGGLMDVVLHPDFARNGLVYWTFSDRGPDGVGTELARGRLAGNRIEDAQVLFRQNPKGTTGRNFGSRLVFDRAGFLYITLGDRGEQDRAQKPDDHAGSVIRLHDDGRVPQDNPFASRAGFRPETGEVHARQPQPAGGGAAPGDRVAVDPRARAAGRR